MPLSVGLGFGDWLDLVGVGQLSLSPPGLVADVGQLSLSPSCFSHLSGCWASIVVTILAF